MILFLFCFLHKHTACKRNENHLNLFKILLSVPSLDYKHRFNLFTFDQKTQCCFSFGSFCSYIRQSRSFRCVFTQRIFYRAELAAFTKVPVSFILVFRWINELNDLSTEYHVNNSQTVIRLSWSLIRRHVGVKFSFRSRGPRRRFLLVRAAFIHKSKPAFLCVFVSCCSLTIRNVMIRCLFSF